MKKCGYDEECFTAGSHWGHHETSMCEHLGEANGSTICLKDKQVIDFYWKNEGKISEVYATKKV